MYVHPLHTVHEVPDLRMAAGRLRDGFYYALQGLNCEDVNERD